ncbi:unannotated protein [freshwater metagenome]|jgi:hypothetical protein|uniref:Unannotated protein n=1 Tax=freshwater metagenome TaxID=449393 RepID=A0A6J6ACC5_9ZZZZ
MLAPVSDKPRQSPALDITEVDDGLVVFESSTRRVHHLNVTATLVFELCTGDNDVNDIASVVRTGFGLDHDPIAEVTTVLDKLRAESLVS